MKFSVFAIAALACATSAIAQPPAASGGPTAAQVAAALQPRMPMPLGPGGARATAVAAEGQTLVFTLDVPAAALQGQTAEQFTAAMATVFCSQGGAALVRSGVSLRLDTATAGAAPTRGAVITSCPAA
jgi:hypothetical protein